MNYEKILGWMTTNDLIAISKLAKNVSKNGVIVEVGSMFGKSAVEWALHVDKSVQIYCFDTWYSSYSTTHNISETTCLLNKFPLSGVCYNPFEEFKNNTKDFDNITMVQGYCPTETKWNNLPIDLFFLDANHKNPNDWEIIEYFIPFIKVNGIICGHDYSINEFPDVVENVERLELLNKTKVKLFDNSSIWAITKND